MRLRVYYDLLGVRSGFIKGVSMMEPWQDVDCREIRFIGNDMIVEPVDRVHSVAHSFHTSIIDRIVEARDGE